MVGAENPFECGLCDENCENEANLEKHWYQAHKEYLPTPDQETWEYECEVCSNTLKNASSLRRHRKTNHR